MPTIAASQSPTPKVLVSGANGYIAVWVVRVLLERGYAVRGTVRSEEKGKHLKKLFESYGDKFELFVVGDNLKDGAFDEAVKGVDAIAHTASPFYMNPKSADELIQPAIKGTTGILESALKSGNSSLKRILILASCASILTVGSSKVFTEEDWNEASVKSVEEKGDAAPGSDIYRASKTKAERAAWDFYNKNKSSISWDLTVLNPPFVFGPAIHDLGNSPDSLNTSAKQWYDNVVADALGTNKSGLLEQGSAWIDVRDLAEAHARALEKEAAGNERIIISAGSFVWQEWIDLVHKLGVRPKEKLSKGLEGGTPKDITHPVKYDTAKEKRLLGIPFKTQEELARDTLKDYEARGW